MPGTSRICNASLLSNAAPPRQTKTWKRKNHSSIQSELPCIGQTSYVELAVLAECACIQPQTHVSSSGLHEPLPTHTNPPFPPTSQRGRPTTFQSEPVKTRLLFSLVPPASPACKNPVFNQPNQLNQPTQPCHHKCTQLLPGSGLNFHPIISMSHAITSYPGTIQFQWLCDHYCPCSHSNSSHLGPPENMSDASSLYSTWAKQTAGVGYCTTAIRKACQYDGANAPTVPAKSPL